MFFVDVKRMNNNDPVIFSTWGFKYIPMVDFREEEIISGVENYLLEKSESKPKQYKNEESFVSIRTYLIKEKNTKNSIIRTRESENTANIYIYGGNWDSNNNGKNGIEILNSLNVKIQNLNVKNGAKNCININKSNVEIDNINILNSKDSGIFFY